MQNHYDSRIFPQESVFVPAFTAQNVRSVLRTEDYDSLESFRSDYFASNSPVLCVVEPELLDAIIPWLRDTDDVEVAGASDSLIRWRLERLNRTSMVALDSLTGLCRRDSMIDHLGRLCSDTTELAPASLILVDFDRFKSLNDKFGQDMGDAVLREASRLLKKVAPDDSFVARMGGGEMAVGLRGSLEHSRFVAESIRGEFERNSWPHKKTETVSCGVATITEKCEAQLLIGRADEALYAAKAEGRNIVVSFDEIFNSHNGNKKQIDATALENKTRVLSDRVTRFITLRSKKMMKKLQQQADMDALTDTFNRGYLERQLEQEIQNCNANSTFCVALIDIDHFGLINKEFGWPTGDEVLKSVCREISNSLRCTDWVARYGGEEFCIVMPETAQTEAVIVTERIRKAVERSLFYSTSGEQIEVTLSAGVVELRPGEDSMAQLIERASEKTLIAKRAGRNRVCAG
ncbi:MAG: GGDEF domain-containing protein [Planctomycetota bacterium]